MNNISYLIEQIILNSIQEYDGTYDSDNSFKELVSIGELVDRLSIVNFKLYKLKDEVMMRPEDTNFKAWASTEDIKLVIERSRLKKCIDEKLIFMIHKIYNNDFSAGFNSEVKKYGNQI
jgi:hypothetical protein